MTVGIFGASCTGDDGAMGPPGPQGEQGPPGMDLTEDPDEPVSEEGCEDFAEGGRTFTGSTGDDVICGDERRNRINADDGDDIVYGKGGNDTLNGDRGDDTLNGGDGDDVLRGGTGNDDLLGDGGKDDFEGGPGNDYMDGGDGDDTFWSLVHGVDDGSDDFVGGDGTDLLSFEKAFDATGVTAPSTWTPADFTATNVVSESNTPELSINLMSGITDFEVGEKVISDVYEGIENLTGSIYDDYLVGDAGDNVIKGLAGNDRIEAGAGNDTIDPGAGTNYVDGGEGNDTLVVTSDTSLAETAITDANKSIENLQGAGDTALTLTGDGKANMLTGSSAGDTLTGGAGKDIFVVVNGGGLDTITDFAIATGSTDMIYFKGFKGEMEVTHSPQAGTNDNLNVDGEAAVTVTDTAAAVIIANDLYKFID